MQIYLLAQEDVNFNRLYKQIKNYGLNKWLYIGEDSTWRVKGEYYFKNKIERVSIANILNDVSWEEREKFIEFIGKNSIQNNSFEWWSSEIAAKNPYNMLYTRICLIIAFKKYIIENPREDLLVVCSTKALKRAVEQLCFEQGVIVKKIRNINILKIVHIINIRLKSIILNAIETFPCSFPLLINKNIAEKYLSKNLFYRKKIIEHIYQKPTDSLKSESILFVTWVDGRSVNRKNEYIDIYFKK